MDLQSVADVQLQLTLPIINEKMDVLGNWGQNVYSNYFFY